MFYFERFQMNDHENIPPGGQREFTNSQRLFVALLKDKQVKYPVVKAQFLDKWPGRQPPSRQGVFKMWGKLHTKHTVKDERKGNSGREKTGR